MLNNREYSKEPGFAILCESAGVKPTKRQASKYRKGKGSAYRAMVRRNQTNK